MPRVPIGRLKMQALCLSDTNSLLSTISIGVWFECTYRRHGLGAVTFRGAEQVIRLPQLKRIQPLTSETIFGYDYPDFVSDPMTTFVGLKWSGDIRHSLS
jgi:hypothetical protein